MYQIDEVHFIVKQQKSVLFTELIDFETDQTNIETFQAISVKFNVFSRGSSLNLCRSSLL